MANFVDRRTLIAAGALFATAGVGYVLSKRGPKEIPSAADLSLSKMIPAEFGGWKQDFRSVVNVVNPQAQQMLDKIYSQMLTRQYVAADSYRIMVTMAYGKNQKGDLQAHKPEICYPAQGFQVLTNQSGTISTPSGAIPVRKLTTELGSRKEPVTYWFTMGDRIVDSPLERRIVEMRYSLTGLIPDGLLVRLSSIDNRAQDAFERHAGFAVALLSSLSPIDRQRLSGRV